MITVNGEEMEWEEGMTVSRVLELKGYTSHLILVKVNGAVVPQTEFGTAEVPDGAEVEALHLVGGG